jgi:ABC-2 type transport system permease protein
MSAVRDRAEDSLPALVVHTWVQTGRLLIRWRHDPQTVIQSLVMPCAFLVSLDLVFGKTISDISGQDALNGTVPMAALVGALFGSTAAGISLMRERDDGLLTRFWALPVHRMAGVLSRLCAEAIRVLATTVLVMFTGLALGFRFDAGFALIPAWLAVPVVFGVAFSFLVTTLALRIKNTVLAEATGIAVAGLFFFCTGFVPLDLYPEWIQPAVAHQPMSYAVDVMRALSAGGPVLVPLAGTLLWSAGIAAVCLLPMVTGYRAASQR